MSARIEAAKLVAPPADAGSPPLGIGVTGHRPERLADHDLDALETMVSGVLASLEAAAPGAHFRLVSSLAEGADTILADAALARGWGFDVVLPFPREVYSRDFAISGPRADLAERLARADAVFELPGRRDEPGGSSAAYERAGRVMLTQVDCLIAVWDGDPPRGRGGAAQIVAEAVAQGVPVLVIRPDGTSRPALLWSGLDAHEFGPESVDTVARGGLDDLPRLMTALQATGDPLEHRRPVPVVAAARLLRPLFALAYPLLLAATGVRRLRRADFSAPKAIAAAICDPQADRASFGGHLAACLTPRFDEADREAGAAAQLFRSGYVSNFMLAAVAVVLSLLGLVLPSAIKPLLVLGEFLAIATILTVTRMGRRAGWHRRWLKARRFAERLRCLALSARLGDLCLRGPSEGDAPGDPTGARAVSRALGLPRARVDATYIAATHAGFLQLLDDQIGYLDREAGRMHRLEHRLHRFGGLLFATTAVTCVAVLLLEGVGTMLPGDIGELAHHLPVGITLVSAALPAIGAAIYGIRMQGDFAGIAERDAELSRQLRHIRQIVADELPDFDQLSRLIRRATRVLTQDVSEWFRASLARPLALPG